jgi:hypothetical protein
VNAVKPAAFIAQTGKQVYDRANQRRSSSGRDIDACSNHGRLARPPCQRWNCRRRPRRAGCYRDIQTTFFNGEAFTPHAVESNSDGVLGGRQR